MRRMRDPAGHEVTTTDPGVALSIGLFTAEVLSHGKQAACILEAAAADPGCGLAQAYAGALYLFLQTAEGQVRAAPYLAAARAAAARAGERERLVIAAMSAWGAGDAGRALTLHREISRGWPTDLLNLKIAQIHQLNAGDRTGMRDLAAAAVKADPGAGYAWGMLAFGLDQTGDRTGAERAGRQAVEMNRDDPWAHHAVAHVLDAQGRLCEGIAWMEGLSATWDRCSSFMYTHNWWHTALFRLDRDDSAGALDLFDRRIWGVRKTYVQDQVNAIALLARLELRGIDVGDRWSDVAAHVRPRIHDHLNGFLDLHFTLALARAGDADGLGQMLESLRTHAARSAMPVWRTVALPAAEGLAAHSRGDSATAARLLAPLLPTLHLLGGSTAQLDLFEQILLDALSRAGRHEDAQAHLSRRIETRAAVPWQHRSLAELYGQLDMRPAAEAALDHARSLSERYLGARPPLGEIAA